MLLDVAWHKDNEASRRLATIPGVGRITASAIVATITDPFQFHSAWHLAAGPHGSSRWPG
jgi:transposase